MKEKFHDLCHHSFIFIPWSLRQDAPRVASHSVGPPVPMPVPHRCHGWLAQVAPGGPVLGGLFHMLHQFNSWSSWGIYEMCGCFNDVCICWRFFSSPLLSGESLGMVDGRLQHPFLQASIYDRRKITEFLAENMSHVEHHLSMGCNDHPAKDERKQVILFQ